MSSQLPWLWCIMEFQTFGNPVGFQSRKYLVWGRKGMRVQVVHDKYDPIMVRIDDIHKISDLISPVNYTVCAHAYMAYTAQKLYECKMLQVPLRIYGFSKELSPSYISGA